MTNFPKLNLLFILLLSVLVFSSCKGQTKAGNTPKSQIATGKEVDKLDPDTWNVFQDREGNYWFGSNGSGVYKFDGSRLTQFTTADGLPSDQIRAIQEDAAGNLFFDTPGGLSKFDGTEMVRLTIDSSDRYNWQLKPGDLWFNGNGTFTGVLRYDGSSLKYLELPIKDLKPNANGFSSYDVYSITKDSRGNLWIGTLSEGACIFDGTTITWIKEIELGALSDGRVPGLRKVLEDRDGNFWLSNILHRYRVNWEEKPIPPSGEYQYEKLSGIPANPEGEYMSLPYFNSGLSDANTGDLWMTTYGDGIWQYDGENLIRHSVQTEGREALVISIFQDREGTLWLGTHGDGVFRFNEGVFEKFEL